MKQLKIGLVYDLREDYQLAEGQPEDFYAEFDSEKTVSSLQKTLEDLGHQVERIGNFHSLAKKIYTSQPNLDLFFNISEGLYGRSREAQVPALLEANQLVYTGSDAFTLALTLNKEATKRVWQSLHLPTASFLTVESVEELNDKRAMLPIMPVFSKPLYAGSSIGIDESACSYTFSELQERIGKLVLDYRQPVLIEEFLSGSEYTVCLLGSGTEAQVFGMTQIKAFNAGGFSIFEEKEAWNPSFFAEVEEVTLYQQLAQLAIKAYRSVECRDIGRVDIRMDSRGNLNLIEINPLPILKDPSTIAWIAQQCGKNIDHVIGKILESSIKRIKN